VSNYKEEEAKTATVTQRKQWGQLVGVFPSSGKYSPLMLGGLDFTRPAAIKKSIY